MKKALLLLLCFVWSIHYSFAILQEQEPSHIQWLQQAGGPGNDHVSLLKADARGNQYMLGSFTETITLNAAQTLNSPHPQDYFIANYNPEGDLLWARRLSSHTASEGSYVVNDMHVSAEGILTIAGSYSGTLSIGTHVMSTPATSTNIFYARFSADGEPLWVKSLGSDTGHETAAGLDVDAEGNVYLTGTLLGNINLAGPEEKLVYTAYLLKTDPSGNIEWTKQSSITAYDQEHLEYYDTIEQWDQYTPRAFGESIRVDNEGNIIVSGSFNLTILWDELMVSTYPRTYDNALYIAKFNPQGEALWANTVDNHYEQPSTFNVLELDASGNIYLAGHYRAAIIYKNLSRYTENPDFMPSELHEIYILKISAAGDGVWLTGVSDATNDDPYIINDFINTVQSLHISNDNRLFVTGYMARNTTAFGDILLTPTPGYFDRYVAELSQAGEWEWVKQIPVNAETNQTQGAVSMDMAGNLILAGDFYGTITLEENSLQSRGGSDIFLASLSFTGPVEPVAGKVQSFTLVNARTNQDIMEIKEGDVLYLDQLPAQLNIRANIEPQVVGSVYIQMDNKKYQRTDNDYPYTLGGDDAATGNYYALSPELKQGAHRLLATPYSGPNASGEKGESLEIRFRVMLKKPPGHVLSANKNDLSIITGLQAYPNPFMQVVSLQVSSEKAGKVLLEIYDMQGRLISKVYEGITEPGATSTHTFDGSHLPNGIYISKLSTDSGTFIQKLVLSK
jgi:hypothetical protein